MPQPRRDDGIGLLSALLLGLVLLSAPALPQAANPSADDIVRALTPKSQPRSMRGVEVQVGKPAPPSIDLYVNFKYNSAELEPDAMIALRSLASALKSPQLQEAKIQIVGHTDAKGSDDYNMQLSERRAAAVRQFLVFSQDVEGARLEALGKGKRELKDASKPEDGINRRVEVRNMSTSATQ
jgi:outer membrane protein OmpA-like peptidoglycan-associated protein